MTRQMGAWGACMVRDVVADSHKSRPGREAMDGMGITRSMDGGEDEGETSDTGRAPIRWPNRLRRTKHRLLEMRKVNEWIWMHN